MKTTERSFYDIIHAQAVNRPDNGKYQTSIDFTYDKDFDIADFLLKHER